MPKYSRDQILLKDVYKFYKKRTEDPLDYKTHKKVLDTWGQAVVEYLASGRDVQLPMLSKIGVRKELTKSYVDHKASKDLGREVQIPNSHSDFYLARSVWWRHKTRIGSRHWTWKASRNLKRAISLQMKKLGGHRVFMMYAGKHNTKAEEVYKTKVLKL